MSDSTSNISLHREDSLECAICLQPCMHPVQLPCSHVFCFLCAKGTAMQSRKCALCRSDIPSEFISNPSLFTKQCSSMGPTVSDAKHVWYYQGYHGWWQYDDRTCLEIEAAHNQKLKSVDVLIAGAVYVIDFENMLQYQRNRNSRKRKIKRDLENVEKKGIAGLELPETSNVATPSSTDTVGAATSSTAVHQNLNSVSGNGIPDRPQVEPEILRQMPVGSEEILCRNQPAGGDADSISVQSNTLTRSVTDYTQNSNVNLAVNLNRCNTYTSTNSHDVDETME